MKTFLIMLAIIPWSVLIGLSYLAYSRVRGQHVQPSYVTRYDTSSIGPAADVQHEESLYCTRPKPHVCKVDGPCNGWPREDLMQQKPLEGWKVADADYVAKMGRA
jgi:hypothetical protein